ncbi:hypothetical protein AAFF_G00369910 [Aldrovandia affinis]|uniref:Uncharacterized protein n=1 Tax=Aldrovandia affinis TaxID=143900 RepID=A0AAD7R568_9TELE|nr:hypothetical protein AAFF_G00369910 [Aldrovandia affinis]
MVQSKYEVLLEQRIEIAHLFDSNNFLDRNADVAPTTCSPKRHLMFLNGHQTGGATVQDMLLRYVDRRNLTLATPPKGMLTFFDQFPFSAKFVRGYKSEKYYDVITHQLRFSKEVKKVLKHNDTFYFSILRNPVTLMTSSYSSFKQDFPAFKLSESLEDFLSNPSIYHNPYLKENVHVKNPIWSDFGFDNIATCSEEQYTKALVEIEELFPIILISEYFDEGMILLKEALCWDIDDVVTFTHDSRNKTDITPIQYDLSSSSAGVLNPRAW